MRISEELVRYVAELSRIRLDGEQTEKMKEELSAVIAYMDVLSGLNTDGTEPLSHVFPINNVMRGDEALASYDRAALLKNAPEHTDETVIVPKTVE